MSIPHCNLAQATSRNCQQWPAMPKPPSSAAPRSVLTWEDPYGGTHGSAPAQGSSIAGATQRQQGEAMSVRKSSMSGKPARGVSVGGVKQINKYAELGEAKM